MNTQEIKKEALDAAKAAGKDYLANMLGGEDRYPCGFAWTTIVPAHKGNTKLGRAERKEFAAMGARKDHTDKNFELWNPGQIPVQNMDVAYAGALAAAEVLRKHGYTAEAGCRMD
jgi:hypothetical protein